MTPEQIIKNLTPKIQKGLLVIKDFVINEADPWIPVDTGALRRSYSFEFEGDFKIVIRYGEGLPYAGAQYFGFKKKRGPRHLLQSGKPIKIIDAVKLPKTGGTIKQRYGMAYYRLQDKLQLMQGFGGQPMWLHRVLKDKNFMGKVRRAFIRSLKL